jgi:hypothetical protein
MKSIATSIRRRMLSACIFIFGILGIYIPIAFAIWGMHEFGIIDLKAFEIYPSYRV